jgi:hypothetical protein
LIVFVTFSIVAFCLRQSRFIDAEPGEKPAGTQHDLGGRRTLADRDAVNGVEDLIRTDRAAACAIAAASA